MSAVAGRCRDGRGPDAGTAQCNPRFPRLSLGAVAELGGLLYPHIEAGLRRLLVRYPLFIVSNCQAGYIEAFLEWSGLAECFRDFGCSGNTRLSKGA